MIKVLLLVAIYWSVSANAAAQIACSAGNIAGIWKECGAVRTDAYYRPPAVVNTGRLREAFHVYNTSTGKIWCFNADGTYVYELKQVNIRHTGRHYRVIEKDCALELSSRKRDLIRIVYIDDSCMILWHNNPKTAWLTVYRR